MTKRQEKGRAASGSLRGAGKIKSERNQNESTRKDRKRGASAAKVRAGPTKARPHKLTMNHTYPTKATTKVHTRGNKGKRQIEIWTARPVGPFLPGRYESYFL